MAQPQVEAVIRPTRVIRQSLGSQKMPSDRRYLRPGEIYAVREQIVQKDDRGAFFWMLGPQGKDSERIGPILVVHVNGPLEYHDDGCGDSYEAIVRRVEKGLAGDTDDNNDADDF